MPLGTSCAVDRGDVGEWWVGLVGFWGYEHGISRWGRCGGETERAELNDSLRGGKGGTWAKFEGRPSKLIKGALSCDSATSASGE